MLFYLDPAINHDSNIKGISEIVLTYHFFPSADQSVATVLQEQIEKHQEEEKALIRRRKELEKSGVVLPEMQKGVVAPGYNPKETPDMFVSKIMQNRKRMENTIKKWEQEELAKRQKEAPVPIAEVASDAA